MLVEVKFHAHEIRIPWALNPDSMGIRFPANKKNTRSLKAACLNRDHPPSVLLALLSHSGSPRKARGNGLKSLVFFPGGIWPVSGLSVLYLHRHHVIVHEIPLADGMVAGSHLF